MKTNLKNSNFHPTCQRENLVELSTKEIVALVEQNGLVRSDKPFEGSQEELEEEEPEIEEMDGELEDLEPIDDEDDGDYGEDEDEDEEDLGHTEL